MPLFARLTRALTALCVIGAVAVGTAQPSGAQEVRMVGSGASFPFPLYSAWFKDFSKKTSGVTIDYQAKGSGAGIQDFINKTVDFAASDSAIRVASGPGPASGRAASTMLDAIRPTSTLPVIRRQIARGFVRRL